MTLQQFRQLTADFPDEVDILIRVGIGEGECMTEVVSASLETHVDDSLFVAIDGAEI